MPKKKLEMRPFLAHRKQLSFFMDSDSEGDEVDLGEYYCEDSDKESDWEPNQKDLDTQREQENEDFNSPTPSKNKN